LAALTEVLRAFLWLSGNIKVVFQKRHDLPSSTMKVFSQSEPNPSLSDTHRDIQPKSFPEGRFA
jgi:hypothetical protein